MLEAFTAHMLRGRVWATDPRETDRVASFKLTVAESVGVTRRETYGSSLMLVCDVKFCDTVGADVSTMKSDDSKHISWVFVVGT